MNAPDKAVAFEALMKDTPGFDHYDSGYDGILPEWPGIAVSICPL